LNLNPPTWRLNSSAAGTIRNARAMREMRLSF